jgi:hypothetical protein
MPLRNVPPTPKGWGNVVKLDDVVLYTNPDFPHKPTILSPDISFGITAPPPGGWMTWYVLPSYHQPILLSPTTFLPSTP